MSEQDMVSPYDIGLCGLLHMLIYVPGTNLNQRRLGKLLGRAKVSEVSSSNLCANLLRILMRYMLSQYFKLRSCLFVSSRLHRSCCALSWQGSLHNSSLALCPTDFRQQRFSCTTQAAFFTLSIFRTGLCASSFPLPSTRLCFSGFRAPSLISARLDSSCCFSYGHCIILRVGF